MLIIWWRALLTSARYSFLVISMTFLPPVLLAILLQEVPRGKILFRIVFYLPASITGLVVILPLLILIAGTIAAFRPLDRLASNLLWPYLAWVAFATLLNASIWWLNR